MSGAALGNAYGEIQIGTGDAESSIASLSRTMRNVGAGLSAAVTAPLLALGATAVNSAASFQQSMAVMEAVTGATAGQMAALQTQALDLGADTVFSAGEAAEAMLELSKAGLTVEETSASIGGVMALAAAGGVGLAEAATLTAAALNTFGLEASESGRIADLLAAGANASAASIGDLGAGLQQGGFAFDLAGQHADDLVASLAILTNVGLSGSDAGTALKNAMMRLMNPTSEAAEAMAAVGFEAYDAQGNMKPLADLIDEFNIATEEMTNQQRDSFLSTVLMGDGMKAMAPLLEMGKDGFLAMKDAVNEQGAAAKAADAQMGGFKGAIETMKGAIDSFLVETALPWLDSMSGIAKSIADAIDWFGSLSPSVKNTALAFAAAAAAVGPLLLVMLGIGTVVGALLSPLGLAVAVVAALGAAWATNFGGIRDRTMEAVAVVVPVLTQLWTWVQATLPGALVTLQGIAASAWTAISTAVSTAWAVVAPLLTQLWTWAVATLPGAFAALQGIVVGAWTTISTAVSTAWGVVGPLLTQLWTWAVATLPGAFAALQGIVAGAWTTISTAVSTAMAVVVPLLTQLWTWAVATLPGAFASLQAVAAGVWTKISGAVSTAQTSITGSVTSVQGMFAGLQSAFAAVAAFFAPAVERIRSAFAGLPASFAPVTPALQGLMTAFQNLWAAVQPILAVLEAALGAVFGVAALVLMNAFAAAIKSLGAIVAIIVNQITLTINSITTVLQNVVVLILAVIQGDWATAWQAAQNIFLAVWSLIEGTINSLWGLVVQIFGLIATTITTTLTDLGVDIEPLLATIQEVWDRIWGALTPVIDTVKSAVESVKSGIEAFIAWISGISIPNPFAGILASIDGIRSKLPGWVPGSTAGEVPGNAEGTNFFRGGAMMVGEHGPEMLVSPPGSRVLTAGQTARRMGEGGGGDIHINMGGVTISNEIDKHRFAYEVAGMIRQYSR